MSSPKIPRISALEGWISFSEGLPAWGMMSLGVCWALGTSVRRIAETGCGSLLPTPTCAGNEHAASMQKWPACRELTALMMSGPLPTPTAQLYGNNRGGAAGRAGKVRPSLEALTGGVFIALREWLMGWPLGWSGTTPLPQERMNEWLGCFRSGAPAAQDVHDLRHRGNGPQNRRSQVAQVKATGNGQVPQVAALAWEVLSVALRA